MSKLVGMLGWKGYKILENYDHVVWKMSEVEEYDIDDDDEKDIELWLFNVRDKFNELVDLYNEADDSETMSMDSVREIFETHIDVTEQLVDLLWVLAFNLKIMNNTLLAIKDLAPDIKAAIEKAKKEKQPELPMFL